VTESIAIVTPSFARDFAACRNLNESVARFFPSARHYVIVDSRDVPLFRGLESSRTVVAAVEDVLPKGYFKLPRSKKWWVSLPAMVPARGWLIQQLVKLSVADRLSERVLVNVDSDVSFIRPVDDSLFVRGERTRLYRLPRGIRPGMDHVRWHSTVCRLLGVAPDPVPMDDYVGNMISWNRDIVLEVRARIEAVTGQPWHVAFTRGRTVSEYLMYGLYVAKVESGRDHRVWLDERPWCHTHWGPGALAASDVDAFVDALPDGDVALSIAGYTGTDTATVQRATRNALAAAAATSAPIALSHLS
jgi:Family of unknown function (DUF6492)